MIDEETKIEACARAAHEVNRAYCIALGDHSQVRWEDAPDWQRSSALNGVGRVLAGTRPDQLHESWLAEKVADGWTYGPVKDADKKQHPCLLAYADLAQDQRAKDTLFLCAVRTMAASLGMEVTYPAIGGYPEHTVDWSKTHDIIPSIEGNP